jgi:hypothetical protein
MRTRIKEKIIKWSRNAKKVEKYSRNFTVFLSLLILFAILTKNDFPESVYGIFFEVLKIFLFVGICLLIFKEVLNKINESEENLIRNNMIIVLLGDRKIDESIILLLYYIIIILLLLKIELGFFEFIIFWICYIIIPKIVAKYFTTKLDKKGL